MTVISVRVNPATAMERSMSIAFLCGLDIKIKEAQHQRYILQ